MTRTILALLLVAGVMAGFASAGSALFTSTAGVAANTFSTGTVVITESHTGTALVTFANMAPGDKVTAPIVVTNSGSLDLRYAVTSTATNGDGKGLMSQLVLKIKGPWTGTCDDAAFAADLSTPLYSGALGSIAGINLIGDPADGPQGGERTLGGSGTSTTPKNETLCFNVSLDKTTTGTGAPGNIYTGYQSATTTATFTFAAEQTANN